MVWLRSTRLVSLQVRNNVNKSYKTQCSIYASDNMYMSSHPQTLLPLLGTVMHIVTRSFEIPDLFFENPLATCIRP